MLYSNIPKVKEAGQKKRYAPTAWRTVILPSNLRHVCVSTETVCVLPSQNATFGFRAACCCMLLLEQDTRVSAKTCSTWCGTNIHPSEWIPAILEQASGGVAVPTVNVLVADGGAV
jgi:hypothetical protein